MYITIGLYIKLGEVICGNRKPETLYIHNFAIIQLGCQCSIQASDLWLPYQLKGCAKIFTSVAVRFPVNDAFLHTFNLSGKLQAAIGNEPWRVPDPILERKRKEIIQNPGPN